MLFAAHGKTPSDADALSLRELPYVIAGMFEQDRNLLIPAALIETAIYNYGGLRGKKFERVKPWDRFPGIIPIPKKEQKRRDYAARLVRAEKQEREFLKAIRRKKRRQQKEHDGD